MWRTYLLNLPHISYRHAHNLMQRLAALKSAEDYPQVLMQMEHEPVVTLGRRSGQDDFVVSEACLLQRGIGVHRIERGGLATYHGPGQLVIYPIFNLRRMKIGVADLVSGLEQAVIDTLVEYHITAERRDGLRGVWVDGEKIASIGIAVRRGISFHGIALNYAPDLANFDLIHPCGIADVKMTSIAKIKNSFIDTVKMRRKVADKTADIFGLTYENINIEHIEKDLGANSGQTL